MRNQSSLLTLLSQLIFLAFLSLPSHAVDVPDWFAGKKEACNAAVPGPLLAQWAPGGAGFGTTWGIPWNTGYNLPMEDLNKTAAPGDGKCCIFDSSGNMIGATRLTDGSDECERILKGSSAGRYSGIYWCTGPQSKCNVNWWFKNR